MKRSSVALIAGSFATLATSCSSPNEIRANSPEEQRLVDRAIQLQVGPTAQGRQALLGASRPVVVYLPEMVCVAFKLKRSALGGESTVCFSRADDSVVINHSEGQ